MRSTIACLGGVVLLVLVIAPASARRIEDWPYERLFKEADLVVIARAEGTADTRDVFKAGGWETDFIGQETTLTVQATLKGDAKRDTRIRVLHYRLPRGVSVVNGPLLVSFRSGTLAVKGTVDGHAFKAALGRPEYLTFLRTRLDGRYEPVSGPIDPALSVRALTSARDLLSELAGE
jgi:hypothetical protein